MSRLDEITCTGTEIARVLKISLRRVRQLAHEKRLPQVEGGRFPLVQCVQIHVERLRQIQEAATADVSEQEWRKRRVAAQAALCELELAERKGQLAPYAVVNAAVLGLITAVRNKFLAVPSHLAAHSPAALRATVFRLAEDRIYEALDELGEGLAEIVAEAFPNDASGDDAEQTA